MGMAKPAVYSEVVVHPMGTFRFSFDHEGVLVRLDLPGRHRLKQATGSRPANAPSKARVRAWLQRRLAGDNADFPGPWQLPGKTPFIRRIYRALAKTKSGQLLTYAELAQKGGSPRAARAVGNAMAQNPMPVLVP